MEKINLLVVDDSALIRSVLRLMARAQPGIEITGEAASGQQALDLVERQRFNGAIIDLNLPDCDGISLIGSLKEKGCCVMVVTGDPLKKFAAMRAGADGYFEKSEITRKQPEFFQRIRRYCQA